MSGFIVNHCFVFSGKHHKQSTKDKLRDIMNDRISNGFVVKKYNGEENGRSKLSSEQVIEMRQLREEGMSYGKLSKKYGVSKPVVINIIKRVKWKHL